MNPNHIIEIINSRAQLERNGKPLRDLASIRTRHMKANNALLVRLDANQLGITDIVWLVRHSPLKRPKVLMVDLNVVLAPLADRLLLRVPNRAVLKRRKHRGRHIVVIHLDVTASKKSLGQQLPGLDSDRRQLDGIPAGRCLINNVAESVNVLDIRLLKSGQNLFAPGIDFDAGLVDAKADRLKVPTGVEVNDVLAFEKLLGKTVDEKQSCLVSSVLGLFKLFIELHFANLEINPLALLCDYSAGPLDAPT